jgi:hypothetical protein
MTRGVLMYAVTGRMIKVFGIFLSLLGDWLIRMSNFALLRTSTRASTSGCKNGSYCRLAGL